jgi:membrane protein
MRGVGARAVRTFRAALGAWWSDNVPRQGASLAYYTLFSVGPVLLVAVAIGGLAFGREAVRGEIGGQIRGLIGTDGARAVQTLLQGAYHQKAGIFATAVGVVTFFLTATGAFNELQTALNAIWRVRPKPGINIRGFLTTRLISFGLAVAVGFLLLVSLVVSAALAAAARYLGQRVGGLAALWTGLNLVISFLVVAFLFGLIYKVLPDVELKWRNVTVGALVTAGLFTVGKFLIGLYLGQSSVASSYGAAGSVLVLLLWVYYSAQVVLLGAEFTRLYTAEQGERPTPMGHAERDPDAPEQTTEIGKGE